MQAIQTVETLGSLTLIPAVSVVQLEYSALHRTWAVALLLLDSARLIYFKPMDQTATTIYARSWATSTSK